jgi:hypothetical protein
MAIGKTAVLAVFPIADSGRDPPHRAPTLCRLQTLRKAQVLRVYPWNGARIAKIRAKLHSGIMMFVFVR